MKASQAHYQLASAIAKEEIVKPEACSSCGATGRIEGHHTDYSKPFDVEWLCPRCHKRAHLDGPIWTGREPEDYVTFQLRTPTALWDQLRTVAQESRRSVNSQILHILDQELDLRTRETDT